jgi:hypothetical protein
VPDLESLIGEARRAALAPEQALIRMTQRRRASRTALTMAEACYTKAAGLVQQAISLLPPPTDSPEGGTEP